MANPFIAKFDSQCQSCGGKLYRAEDKVFVNDHMFICSACATEAGVVCDCGNYKKEQYAKCFSCGSKKEDPDAEDESDSWHEKL